MTGVATLIAAIGAPEAEHLEYATGLLGYLSPSIREALGDAVGAQAVMLGCLIDAELGVRTRQLRALHEFELEDLARKAEVLAPTLRELDRAYRLPLIALAVPPLKGMDKFSLLAHAGSADEIAAQAAFDKGKERLEMPSLALAGKDTLVLAQVSAALERLAGLAPAEKERLLEGFAAAIAADENVRLMEHELLRAVACVLDCPMPPSIAALDPRLLRK